MLLPSGLVLHRDVHWNQALSLSAAGKAHEPPRPGKPQDRLESNVPLVCKETKRKKTQGLLSAINIWPLQASLPCKAFSTLGWVEEGLPPLDTQLKCGILPHLNQMTFWFMVIFLLHPVDVEEELSNPHLKAIQRGKLICHVWEPVVPVRS